MSKKRRFRRKASGGAVTPAREYLVGETGPEQLVRIREESGSVVSHDEQGDESPDPKRPAA